jgi:hypothetical protein
MARLSHTPRSFLVPKAREAMGGSDGDVLFASFNLANKQAHFDTYIKLKPENYSTDTGKLQAQLQCVGPVCCSLDITDTKTIDLISAWNISIPG